MEKMEVTITVEGEVVEIDPALALEYLEVYYERIGLGGRRRTDRPVLVVEGLRHESHDRV